MALWWCGPGDTQVVYHWWNTEIAPWMRIILGRWDTHRFENMTHNEQWMYIKYRFDIHSIRNTTTTHGNVEGWDSGCHVTRHTCMVSAA